MVTIHTACNNSFTTKVEHCKRKIKRKEEDVNVDEEQEHGRSAPDNVEQHLPPDDDVQQGEENQEVEDLPYPNTGPGSSSASLSSSLCTSTSTNPRVEMLPSGTVRIINATVATVGGQPITLSSPKYPTIQKPSIPSVKITSSNANIGGSGFSCTRNTSAEPRPCLNITTLSVRSIYWRSLSRSLSLCPKIIRRPMYLILGISQNRKEGGFQPQGWNGLRRKVWIRTKIHPLQRNISEWSFLSSLSCCNMWLFYKSQSYFCTNCILAKCDYFINLNRTSLLIVFWILTGNNPLHFNPAPCLHRTHSG